MASVAARLAACRGDDTARACQSPCALWWGHVCVTRGHVWGARLPEPLCPSRELHQLDEVDCGGPRADEALVECARGGHAVAQLRAKGNGRPRYET
eukprot:6028193-Prymnesium_polylepis.1